MKKLNKITGAVGEIEVANYLKAQGYKILGMNYKNKIGEIDIVAFDKNVTVFVEVKRRSTLAFGRPCEAVDFRKQQKIRRVAELYLLQKQKYYSDVRFDVVDVLGDEITHIKNAF